MKKQMIEVLLENREYLKKEIQEASRQRGDEVERLRDDLLKALEGSDEDRKVLRDKYFFTLFEWGINIHKPFEFHTMNAHVITNESRTSAFNAAREEEDGKPKYTTAEDYLKTLITEEKPDSATDTEKENE